MTFIIVYPLFLPKFVEMEENRIVLRIHVSRAFSRSNVNG